MQADEAQLGDPRINISGAISPSFFGDQKRPRSVAGPIGPEVEQTSESVARAPPKQTRTLDDTVSPANLLPL